MQGIAPRRLSRAIWRQTRPRNGLLDISDPSTFDARYNGTGEPGAWYASFSERGAWAELFRHWGLDEVSPFEVRRRVGRARVTDLAVLDLTDPNVRDAVGIEEGELVGNDWSPCQQVADHARAADGLLAPSAALAGETTLVVFAHRTPRTQTPAQHPQPDRSDGPSSHVPELIPMPVPDSR